MFSSSHSNSKESYEHWENFSSIVLSLTQMRYCNKWSYETLVGALDNLRLGKRIRFFFRGYTKKHLYYQFQALYTLNHLINHTRKLYLFICINADGNGFIAERYWRSLLSLFSQYHFLYLLYNALSGWSIIVWICW